MIKSDYLWWFAKPTWLLFIWQQAIIMPFLILFYLFFWQEKAEQRSSLTQKIADQQINTKAAHERLNQLPLLEDIQQHINQIENELSKPRQNAVKITAIKQLQQPLINSGAQLLEWQRKKEGEKTLWQITIYLNYEQMLNFLEALQALYPPLLIKQLSISPSGEFLNVKITLSETSHEELYD
ncbi:hypothetical protein TI10_13410 [Photorhabdus luminescens subsp. luminescens]|uniref:Pilus assembly protein HofO n=1 Tax=Photorhabdus luminescens TaxID=29488 RepID=A0A1G5QCW3_PHOLU|nr:hypothetical protein [Photorhabdus luminescens]KMW72458.1 hypothetical protein TI10_13410 [Photorhabdus luminescens subsp. luminescens]SCZ59492.1 pilus assembly protein HofO [Photorhabdus luminescens]